MWPVKVYMFDVSMSSLHEVVEIMAMPIRANAEFRRILKIDFIVCRCFCFICLIWCGCRMSKRLIAGNPVLFLFLSVFLFLLF